MFSRQRTCKTECNATIFYEIGEKETSFHKNIQLFKIMNDQSHPLNLAVCSRNMYCI